MKKNITFLLGMLVLGAVQLVQGMDEQKGMQKVPFIPVEKSIELYGRDLTQTFHAIGKKKGVKINFSPEEIEKIKKIHRQEFDFEAKGKIFEWLFSSKSDEQKSKIRQNIQNAVNANRRDIVYFPQIFFLDNDANKGVARYYMPLTTADIATYLGIVKTKATGKKNKKKDKKQPQQTASTSAVLDSAYATAVSYLKPASFTESQKIAANIAAKPNYEVGLE